MGQVLGGCHQVYVICPLVLEAEENLAQFLIGHLPAEVPAADFMILAEAAAQGTSAEKYGAASPGAADAGFFPVVQCGPGSHYTGRSLAETSLNAAVNAAHAGAELAMVNLFLKIG